MYYLIVTDRYNLWTKGPYDDPEFAKEVAVKMVTEDTSGLVTKVEVVSSIGTVILDDKTATWVDAPTGEGTT